MNGNINGNTYRELLLRAKTMQSSNDQAHYWEGYIRGLRRAHYGDRYGTTANHLNWLALRGDAAREEMASGYRDGFAGRRPAPEDLMSSLAAGTRKSKGSRP